MVTKQCDRSMLLRSSFILGESLFVPILLEINFPDPYFSLPSFEVRPLSLYAVDTLFIIVRPPIDQPHQQMSLIM